MASHNVFIAGNDIRDCLIYRHRDGGHVTIVEILGSAALVRNLLFQLSRTLRGSEQVPHGYFIKHESNNIVTFLEVEELKPKSSLSHRIKSQLRLHCPIRSVILRDPVNIEQNDLLVVEGQHDMESFEVDPWYRIFQRSGDTTTMQPPEAFVSLRKYATQLDAQIPDCWKPLCVVIDVDYLRWKNIEISHHLSWAQATEDLLRNFVFSQTLKPELQALQGVEHLIVRFDCDGVIHIHNPPVQNVVAHLYIQKSENSEGDFIQSTPGRTPAVAAGFMAGFLIPLAQDETAFTKAIRCGLFASQKAALAKIDVAASENCFYKLNGFTSEEFRAAQAPDGQGAALQVLIPSSRIMNRGYRWKILQTILGAAEGHAQGNEDQQMRGKTKDLADDIVKRGSKTALASIPTARFGNLITADRQEQESFRAIANLVAEYLRSPQEKPISIGVFGAPGSGKSFGIKEVVKAVAERSSNGVKRVSKPLTFNLSQFREYHDLVVAFHTIRDRGLSNEVPLVLFDEFDSGFGDTKLGWLQYLLAPMQDGKFLENGHERPLGPGIFVFIGGTCSTFEDFTTDLESRDARGAKKPDFVSRLRGFVNIQGSQLSPRDNDYMYLVRRAIHLRAMLKSRVGCRDDEEIQLDEGVLNALLTVPYFRHGARSLESIIAMSQLHGQRVFRRSALPSAKQLGLHVDYTTFVDCFKPDNHRTVARDAIASQISGDAQSELHQRIAAQILDMIYNNGAYLVPLSGNGVSSEERQALINDLAKYHYYAFEPNNVQNGWEVAGEGIQQPHKQAIESLLGLLERCQYAVRRRS